MVMFGITKIVKGYSIQTYYLYCYAIFISEDITRQRGGVTFGTPCITENRSGEKMFSVKTNTLFIIQCHAVFFSCVSVAFWGY